MRLKITKKKSVVEKADLIIKKDMTHKEMMREKKKIWKVRVYSLKESSEKAMEVNNELRLNVDKQQDDKNI